MSDPLHGNWLVRLAGFGLLALLLVGILSSHTGLTIKDGSLAVCNDVMSSAAVCQLSLFNVDEMLQAVLPGVLTLLAASLGFAVIISTFHPLDRRWPALSRFRYLVTASHLERYWQRYFAYNWPSLQWAFARGILHPKLHQ